MNSIRQLFFKVRKKVFDIQLRIAVRKANRDAELFKRRLLVISFGGIPKIYEKQKLKRLIQSGYFRKGTTIQQLEKMAYHITK